MDEISKRRIADAWARVDGMDAATWLLALGALAGMWIGGLI